MAENIQDSPVENNDDDTREFNGNTNSNNNASSQPNSNPSREKYLWEHVQDFFTTFNDGSARTQTHQRQQPQSPSAAQSSSTSSSGGSNSWKRLGHLMCYDPGVAAYIIFVFFWVVWLPVGIWMLISVRNEQDCDQVADYAQNSVVCGFIYVLLVGITFCCSMIFLKV